MRKLILYLSVLLLIGQPVFATDPVDTDQLTWWNSTTKAFYQTFADLKTQLSNTEFTSLKADQFESTQVDGFRFFNVYNPSGPDPSTCNEVSEKGSWSSSGTSGELKYYCDGTAWQLSSGGSISITEQVSDPVVGDLAIGDLVVASGSGDMFYRSTSGFYTFAGIYTADPVLYTLTVTDPGNNDTISCSDADLSAAINCGNGATDCSATAASGSLITGMTATADTGRQFDIWTGAITSTENPTTTALTMDGNKSVGATFSIATVTADFHVAFEETTGTVLTPTTNTLGITSVGASTDMGGLTSVGLVGNGLERDGAAVNVRVNGTDFAIFTDGDYTYQFAIKSTGTQTYGVKLLYNTLNSGQLYVTASSATNLNIYSGGSFQSFTVPNMEDGAWHVYRVTYGSSTLKLYHGSTEANLSLVDTWAGSPTPVGTGDTILGLGADTGGAGGWLGVYDEFKLWDAEVAP